MGLLDDLLGGGQHQQQLQHFAERYSRGSPHEGYTPQEAQQAYQQVARLTNDEVPYIWLYVPSAVWAYSTSSTPQRARSRISTEVP